MQPFRIYRKIEVGETFLVAGDCSQGGKDSNVCAFLSKTKLDYPIVYKKRGVAADMTVDIFPVLEWLFDTTGIAPIVAFERNNGGGSEMERLRVLNRNNKYRIYLMKKSGQTTGEEETKDMGYNTNTATRPVLVGDWKQTFDAKLVKIYDEDVIDQHMAFVVNNMGKPEAAKNRHDDAVIAPAIGWQMYQNSNSISNYENENKQSYGPNYESINQGLGKKWSI